MLLANRSLLKVNSEEDCDASLGHCCRCASCFDNNETLDHFSVTDKREKGKKENVFYGAELLRRGSSIRN